MTRDLIDYSTKYLGPFEEIQVLYRRKKVLEIIQLYQPKTILEVGCGKDSLVNYIDPVSFKKFYIIEPIADFLNSAVSVNYPNVIRLNNLIENIDNIEESFDLIIVSSLLHEVIDPLLILKEINRFSDSNTIIHINVPNALSFHRLLAMEAGLIDSVYDYSGTQLLLQQHHTFDLEILSKLTESAGFQIIDKGSYFVKPFTHSQMQKLVDDKIVDSKVLDGFYHMIKYLPEYGSEIFINVKKLQ
jgi:ubiquinone/menaquinone biosynthesis C-methylase UbiE